MRVAFFIILFNNIFIIFFIVIFVPHQVAECIHREHKIFAALDTLDIVIKDEVVSGVDDVKNVVIITIRRGGCRHHGDPRRKHKIWIYGR